MCKCTPHMRTPFCGMGDCVWPDSTPTNMTEAETLEAAIEKFGKERQMLKAIEEMSELQKELCKYLSYPVSQPIPETIIDEIADVYIMILQMKIIAGAHAVENRMQFKLNRLEKRIMGSE